MRGKRGLTCSDDGDRGGNEEAGVSEVRVSLFVFEGKEQAYMIGVKLKTGLWPMSVCGDDLLKADDFVGQGGADGIRRSPSRSFGSQEGRGAGEYLADSGEGQLGASLEQLFSKYSPIAVV